MRDDILVSVCMPTYNQGEFIEEALCSVMNQTHRNLEIIVGDNASTDDTEYIVKKVMRNDGRIRYIRHQTNIGAVRNFNFLIKQAKGEYIASCFSDDVFMPTIIEEEVGFLERNDALAGVFTFKQDIDKLGNLLPTCDFVLEKNNKNEDVIVDKSLYFKHRLEYNENVLLYASSLIKKNVYEEMGGLNSEWYQISDFELFTRILEKYKLGIINKRLIKYRRHDNQSSRWFLQFNRDRPLVSLAYLSHYLDQGNNADLKAGYGRYLDKLLAEDYLMLALHNIFKGERGEAIKFIKLSQGYFRFFLFSKGWLLQHSGRFVVYIFIRSYLQIKRAFVVNVLKRPYVFDV